jgi:nucleotide-binding universal stress UspA family protein
MAQCTYLAQALDQLTGRAMQKIKKILFPTDFSETAQNAFRYCIAIADQYEASIELLHVVFPEYEALDLPVMAAQATKERVELAQALTKTFVETALAQVQAASTLEHAPMIKAEVEIGTPSNVIVEIARRDEIDLIVIGTRGEHSALEHLFGSVTTAVAQKAPCHVWIVPENSRLGQIDIVAYASNLTEGDPYHIWEVGKILEPFSPIIHCVHVNNERSTDRVLDFASLGAFFEHHAPALQINFHVLTGASVEEAIAEFVDIHDVDVLVMYTAQQSWLDRLFRKSYTRSMAFATHVPLFILKK